MTMERGRLRAAMKGVMGGIALALASGCGPPPDLPVPTAEQVRDFYQIRGNFDVEMNGNVAEVTVTQAADQLRRGGSTWAKSGPYIYLFSEATRDLFDAWPGLAGVRVTTRPASGREMVATAFLRRDTLNPLTWSRALNASGLARRDGSTNPGRMAELVRYGEQIADEHEYNPRYTR
jgi:hypothetical protein